MWVPTSPESTRPLTRRQLRERSAQHGFAKTDTESAASTAVTEHSLFLADTVAVDAADEPSPATETKTDEPRAWADEKRPATALTWIDPSTASAGVVSAPDLFAGARLVPGWLRPRVLVPLSIVAALCGSYIGTTLLWPLNSVAPTVQASTIEIAPAPAAAVTWPTQGSAAVGIEGISTIASSTEPDQIASISKVVSVLMVLDELPLKPGEQGPSFAFTSQDASDFWSYRRSNQSSLDVPVGGSLTEYQMLQGVLLGSANNYIDRLSDEIWGSDRRFAEASEQWLSDRGIDDVVLKSPSGFSRENVASPAALIQIGELAMKNPVFAEIVGTKSAEIPGAGLVANTNRMLEDNGVVGLKTGTLSKSWNLLTAKDVPVGESTVRLYAAVLDQDGDKERVAATRSLFAEVEKSLADQPVTVPKGTVVGRVSTEWGERVDVVTDADVRVVLWNGSTATASTEFTLEDQSESGAKVGTLTASGPVDSAKTAVSLDGEVAAPSFWWRLTHPLELFGLDKD